MAAIGPLEGDPFAKFQEALANGQKQVGPTSHWAEIDKTRRQNYQKYLEEDGWNYTQVTQHDVNKSIQTALNDLENVLKPDEFKSLKDMARPIIYDYDTLGSEKARGPLEKCIQTLQAKFAEILQNHPEKAAEPPPQTPTTSVINIGGSKS
jgi:hypothetical protein